VQSFPITLIFRDSEAIRLECRSCETVVQAAARQGIRLLTDCREGGCGTCKAEIQSGQYSLDDYSEEALSAEELAKGLILTCRLRPESPCIFEFDYDLAAVRPGAAALPRETAIASVEKIADDVLELTVQTKDGMRFNFLPGQYANLQVPGTEIVRSYSFVNIPGSDRATFLIRLLRGGAMSGWLQETAPGAPLLVASPFGRFFIRDAQRPLVFVAGGTGVGPVVSMLEWLRTQVVASGTTVKLAFGVNTSPGLFYRERLERLVGNFPQSKLIISIINPDVGWDGVCGTAVDALSQLELGSEEHVYLCGPPTMVERSRAALASRVMSQRSIFAEAFLPTSYSQAT
jgi:ferredoxin-NADP reductase/ferredoxin